MKAGGVQNLPALLRGAIMLRELFASKSLVVVLIGCGLLIVGIHFWSQHEHSKLRHDEAETRRFIQQVAAEKQAATTRAEEPDIHPQLQEVTHTAQGAPDDFAMDADEGTPVGEDAKNAIEVGALVEEELFVQEAPAEPRRTSLFGFGVYPEIPPDYREPDVWERIEERALTDPSMAERQELMARVCIKLWKQGLHSVGVSRDSQTGLIYPHYPNTAYVRWAWDVDENGSPVRYAAGVTGGADLAQYQHYFAEGELPPHITVIDYEEGGIDPYQFLDLQHE